MKKSLKQQLKEIYVINYKGCEVLLRIPKKGFTYSLDNKKQKEILNLAREELKQICIMHSIWCWYS